MADDDNNELKQAIAEARATLIACEEAHQGCPLLLAHHNKLEDLLWDWGPELGLRRGEIGVLAGGGTFKSRRT